MKSIIVIIALILLFPSCKEGNKRITNKTTVEFTDKDFPFSVNVKTHLLSSISDSLIFTSIPFIHKSKGHLFISESKSEYLFHVIKIPEDIYIGGYVKRGEGPGEGLMSWSIYETENKLLGLYDDKQKKIIEFNVDTLLVSNNFSKEYNVLATLQTGRVIRYNEKIYFTDRYGEDKRILFSIDTSGKNRVGYGELPNVRDVFFEFKNRDVFTTKLAHNKNVIGLCYTKMPLIEIFQINTSEWISIVGPNRYTPNPKDYLESDFYEQIRITDNYVYALYHQTNFGNDDPRNQNYNLIYVFDLKGQPVKMIKLDSGIYSFDVYKDSLLYGLGISHEGNDQLRKAKL